MLTHMTCMRVTIIALANTQQPEAKRDGYRGLNQVILGESSAS